MASKSTKPVLQAVDVLAGHVSEHFDALVAAEAEADAQYVPERWVGLDHINSVAQVARDRAAQEAGTGLDEAGWSAQGAGSPPTGREGGEPLPRPTLAFDREVHGPGWTPQGKRLNTQRHIWIARFNPANELYATPEGTSTSDVAAPGLFGWDDPATVVVEGRNYWLSTLATPNNRPGIFELETGDLVVIQRSAPGPGAPSDLKDARSGNGAVLYGLAAVWQIEEWDNLHHDGPHLDRRERRVGLLPLSAFTYPVSRSQLQRRGRLRSERFSKMNQRLDGSGPMGFTLSPITDDRDINELLAVCGLSPDVLTEPDITVVAARVSVSVTGDKDLFDLRWDNRYRHIARLRHEHIATARAKEWASDMQWGFLQSAERVPLAGYDLLFTDPAIPATPWPGALAALGGGADSHLNVPWNGVPLLCHVEVEVKGYSAADLASVHLQPSQARRARESAAGRTPPWWLFAVLGVGGPSPTQRTLSAVEVVAELDAGRLQVR